mgnify:CR=1 FL=1
MPVTVPPVPTPATKISTFPSVSSQISGPVVAACAAGFAGLSNCPRITAPGIKEAKNLENIHVELRRRGYTTPLSADIHFNPEAAIEAAKHVEKVRINPGNFVDKRATFKTLTYADEEYAAELERLREKFSAFLNVCREYGTAVRIGTNHGSLSDRIMSRYGNTPAGMVEATMEYLRVCRDEKFDDVVISLKSSAKIMKRAIICKSIAKLQSFFHPK